MSRPRTFCMWRSAVGSGTRETLGGVTTPERPGRISTEDTSSLPATVSGNPSAWALAQIARLFCSRCILLPACAPGVFDFGLRRKFVRDCSLCRKLWQTQVVGDAQAAEFSRALPGSALRCA